MALAVVGPAQREDLPLAASREQEEAARRGERPPYSASVSDSWRTSSSDRNRSRPLRRYRRMPLHGLESSGLRPIASASRMTTERMGRDRSAAAGVARNAANHATTSAAVDLRHRASREMGQELVLEIAPVDGEGPRLPDPGVALEHGLDEILEEGLPRFRVLAPADRGEHFGCSGRGGGVRSRL